MIDIVKEPPKTELEAFRRWVNNLTSWYISKSVFSIKVEVK